MRMTDLITKLKKEQLTLAEELAEQLFNELKPYIDNGKIKGIGNYVRLCYDKPDYDPEAMRDVFGSDLLTCVIVSIQGYTNWVACRIVRSIEYSVPLPIEIDFKVIEKKYDAPRKTLERTVSFMHSKESLPLLGRIEEGDFCPDRKELEEWKEFYDWSQ